MKSFFYKDGGYKLTFNFDKKENLHLKAKLRRSNLIIFVEQRCKTEFNSIFRCENICDLSHRSVNWIGWRIYIPLGGRPGPGFVIF